jgi:hypothetical protein
MSNQTSEAFAYIEREYEDAKGRVELQRRAVEQLHMVEADAGEAEASLNASLEDLNASLEDEASKLRILSLLGQLRSKKMVAAPAHSWPARGCGQPCL